MNKVKNWAIAALFLMLAVLPVRAQKRTEAQAKEAALNFFSQRATKSADSDITLMNPAWDDEFYIYGRDGGGFVIISSEKATDTVLGYSENSVFDVNKMPQALEAWLENLESHVKSAQSIQRSHPAEKTKAGGSKVLETAEWDQLSPYNNKCPELAPAGCTAVSVAIALRYLKWPDTGTGTLPGYSYEDIHKKSHTVDSLVLGHSYLWDEMPLKGVSKDNVDQIATIIRDCGIMLQSKYSYTDNGTSAYNEDILPALKKYMKYDASGVFSYSKCSSSADWKESVMSEIDASRPVIYSGRSSKDEGHSFVVDGYDEEGRFHINWGWGGQDNGFFTFPEFGEYSLSHSAIFGLKKDEGGKQEDMIYVQELKASTEKFSRDSSFTAGFKMYNFADDDFTGSVALVRMSDQGEIKEIISGELEMDEPLGPFLGLSYENVSCTIKGNIDVGDLMTLAFKDRYGEWKQCSFDHDNPYSAMISISDAIHLDEATSFKWDGTSKTVILKTKEGTSCSVIPAVPIMKDGSTFTLKGFSKGIYKVELICGVESCSFEIEL